MYLLRSSFLLSFPYFLIAYRFKEAEAAQLDRAYVHLTTHVCIARHCFLFSHYPRLLVFLKALVVVLVLFF